MKPNEWYKEFLKSRNLEQADGRHLYEYRVKDFEFIKLQEILKQAPINYDSIQMWDSCFVLYAAEWWRRNYKNGHWTWDTIFTSIGKSVRVNERGQIVQGGLKKWKQSLYKDKAGNKDYLVTIIIESGLPIETVSKESAWLKRIVKESFEEYNQISYSEFSSEEIIARNAQSIIGFPSSLMKPEIYTLLSRIIKVLSDLKKEYQLTNVKSAIELLDQKKPDWRLSFPIQIDSEVGKKLIDELLTEIVSIEEPRPYVVSFKRLLIKDQNSWSVISKLEIPNSVYDCKDLRVINQAKLAALPPRMNLVLRGSNGERKLISTAYKTSKGGETVIKMSGTSVVEGPSSVNKWGLVLSFEGEEIELPLTRADALSHDVPWVFVRKNDEWLLEGLASHQTKADSAIVSINGNIDQIDGEFQEVGAFGSRKLLKINGSVVLHSADNYSFKIGTKANIDTTSYALHGVEYKTNTKHTHDVFLGLPTVYSIKPDTLFRTLASGNIQIRPVGNGSWVEPQSQSVGLMDIRLVGKNREILFSQRIGVLPSSFNIQTTSINLTQGKFIINNSSDFKVQVLGEGIESSAVKISNGHEISLRATNELPPEFITLILLEQNSLGEIRLQLPFPAKGAKFFDKNGIQLKRGALLHLKDLHGIRLHLFNNLTSTKYYCKFNLKDENITSLRDIYIKKAIPVTTSHVELPLISWEEILQRIFSVSPNLDKGVLLDVFTAQGSNSVSIEVKQYSCELSINQEDAEFTLKGISSELDNTQIKAIRLDQPNREQEPQIIFATGGVENGSKKWRFKNSERPEGVWMIYPESNSTIFFRPKIWSLGSKQTTTDLLIEIAEVAYQKGRDARITKLVTLINSISNDFHNINWKELELLWAWTNHLPLSAFDVWTAFSQSPKGLVSLICQFERNLIDRFNSEFPIIWEAIAVDDWVHGFKHFKEYTNELFPSFSHDIIDDKIQYVEKQLRLECTGEILRAEVLSQNDNQQFMVECPAQFIKNLINGWYKGGHEQPGLLHKDAETDWPELLRDELTRAFENLPNFIKDILPQISFDHHKSAVYLPALLAFKTIDSKAYPIELTPDKVFKMAMIRAFDEQWFYSIYNVVQSQCWKEMIKKK